MSVASSVVCLIPLIRPVDKAVYPRFNIYPSPVPLVKHAPRPEGTDRGHKELDNEAALHLSSTTPVSPKAHTAADMISWQPYGLTIIARQQELYEEPLSLSSTPTVSPLRLRRRVPSLKLDERDSGPLQPRTSSAFDIFQSMSQSKDETAEPLDMVPTAPTRSQSLSVRPVTPKRRQSALIAERIRALNAAIESPEPTIDRPARRSTRSLPISLMSA